MKKKLIKKVNILNRTTHINFYSNYILYNYLNNYNLKYYFLFNTKRRNYSKFVSKFKLIFSKNINNNLNIKSNFNLSKSDMYINNQKDKFFKPINQISSNYYYYKNYKYSQTNTQSGNFLITKNSDFLINDLSIFNTLILYKELMTVTFLLNLSKIFEIYKILTLLVLFNSNFKI